VNGTRRLHLYSATNERIATVQMVGNTPSRWDWTIRDASGKVLRRFSNNNANTWSWDEDYIYRGAVLANVYAATANANLAMAVANRILTKCVREMVEPVRTCRSSKSREAREVAMRDHTRWIGALLLASPPCGGTLARALRAR
ncbi:MAG TPA: hypothetical protein VND45_06380, partial [Thermoanaerobaculia bacterium]|nr:hypothetical protein [Thermoanaerobaculia bacterium]